MKKIANVYLTVTMYCNPTKFHLLFDGDFDIIICIGVWRSLVARSAGGREVASSNLVTPIKASKIKGSEHFYASEFFFFLITFDYLYI